MKTTNPVSLSFLLCGVLTLAATGQCQVYSLTASVSGVAEMSLGFYQGGSPAIGGINANANFGILTETIYFDPLNLTVRQVGSVAMSYSNPTNTRALSQTVGGQTVTGQLITGQKFTGGDIGFDTGTLPVVWDNTLHAFRLPPTGPSHPALIGKIPVSGSFSLDTGGQNYAGNFNYQILDDLQVFSVFATNSNPALLTLSGFGGNAFNNTGGGFYYSDHLNLTDFTANNGLRLSLYTGNASDSTDSIHWSAGPASATVVPEPNSLSLAGLAVSACALLRRRKR